MKIAVVGDTHANLDWLCNLVIPHALAEGCSKTFQVGDWGYIWSGDDAENNRLHKLDRVLAAAGLDLHFLPGNHENHDLLADYVGRVPVSSEGHHAIRPHILYTGRVSSWEWNGKKIAAVGGAVSIDRQWRQSHERTTGQKIWWPQETLNPNEIREARALGLVDVLFTHDAPTSFPEGWLKQDLESTMNRQVITDIGRALRPKLLVHGHYHCSVTYPFRHEDGTCEVRGLDCDGSAVADGVAIINLGNRVDSQESEL